ncbi:hypothetical protein NQ315_014179 [Exocentrus adspersus]|uniref:Carboxylesterase type B domain-containing protein n=1 Tax=Exocentrus adspersus TaxID=1586481 RepID=A0AAV8VVQ0_9CUCU|nr:hypothetical protein NQ315_014179 [Exocentrus adspersus]
MARGYIKLLVSKLCLFMLLLSNLVKSDPVPDQRTPLTSRTVRTKYGDVSGVIVTLESKHLEPVEVFRGIPYASPPLGSLRFMPPVTGALWQGVKIADKFSPVCPQRLPDIGNETAALKRMPRGRLEYLKRLLPYLKEQSEDCLYLNIYAPAQDTCNAMIVLRIKTPNHLFGVLLPFIDFQTVQQHTFFFYILLYHKDFQGGSGYQFKKLMSYTRDTQDVFLM